MKTWTGLCALFLMMVPTANAQFMGDRQAKLVVTKPIEFMNETRKVEAVGSARSILGSSIGTNGGFVLSQMERSSNSRLYLQYCSQVK